MLCRMQASVIQHHQRGFHVQAPVRHLLCRSRQLPQAATQRRWGSVPAQGFASCRGQTSTCHSAAGDGSNSSSCSDHHCWASSWSIADQQAVAQQTVQAPWLLKPGVDVPWWPHLVWCDLGFRPGKFLTIAAKLLEGMPGLSDYLQHEDLPVKLTFVVHDDDWRICTYIQNHKDAHLQPTEPYDSAAQGSSSSQKGSRTVGRFMATLCKTGTSFRVISLQHDGTLTPYAVLTAQRPTYRVVLQERLPDAAGVLAFKLHLQPTAPSGFEFQQLAEAQEENNIKTSQSTLSLTPAGQGMGLQVVPFSVPEVVWPGLVVSAHSAMHGGSHITVPKILICSQVPADASFPLPVHMTIAEATPSGRRIIFRGERNISSGPNHCVRVPASSLSPAYQGRTISRMVLTTDSPPQLIVDLDPPADKDPDSTPAPAPAPAPAPLAAHASQQGYRIGDLAKRRPRRTSSLVSIQRSLAANAAATELPGSSSFAPPPAQPGVAAGGGVPSPAVTDAGHGQEEIIAEQQDEEQQQLWPPAAVPESPRESFDGRDATITTPADPARAPAPSSGSSSSQAQPKQQQLSPPSPATAAAAGGGVPLGSSASKTAAGAGPVRRLADVDAPMAIERELQELVTRALPPGQAFKLLQRLRVCFDPFRTGTAAEEPRRLQSLQNMYAYVRAAEACGGDDGTLVLQEIEALLEACSS